ncbi:PREDICTED: putative pentatricopeptide repeat-containing protein At1g56570 [Tarenaya hassleriana]|uniref:putative pentatricopeptide repeat-containing protein At1g56570 n=1 Tax=Tarenaya hassleriana TaxID=28532 RepID=UPI00053C878E|nr:PREDICTED: putative pentatricopeptide repeat-containing protein At1g56570 [Tarenaya hassleriana]
MTSISCMANGKSIAELKGSDQSRDQALSGLKDGDMTSKKLLSPSVLHSVPQFLRNSLRNACIEETHHRPDFSYGPDFSYDPKKPSILATSLIGSYFERGLVGEARSLFDEMPERDVVAWTAMITGYASCNYNARAWECFREMMRKETRPNEFTLSTVLKACRSMKVLSYGASVHGLVLKFGMEGSLYVDNALMDMYATCSATMDQACAVFRGIHVKNDVIWTTLITGFTHRGEAYCGLKMFKQMLLEDDVAVTPYCLTIAVRACTSIGSLATGKQIHSSVIKHGFQSNLPVMNSILDMYCRCGCLSETNQYFHDMEERNLITWNTLIAAHERSDSIEALLIFLHLELLGLTPNCYTFTSVIATCANIAALNCGQQLHGKIYRKGFHQNVALANALIDMYAKCGNIPGSHRVFSEITERNLVSWTSMMIGYGSHGYGAEAVDLFDEMVSSGIRPDRIVFMAVLSACSHAGLVDEGLKYFKLMKSKYGLNPDREIYNCVVDLLGRAGRVDEAYEIIENMPFKPDESTWGALLGACKAHKRTDLGILAAKKVQELKPRMVGTYVMLSYIYAAEGKWGEFARVRKVMRTIGNKKEAGRSWIEVKNRVFSFVVSDKTCPRLDSVYSVLGLLILDIREAGYVPDLHCLKHDQETRT